MKALSWQRVAVALAALTVAAVCIRLGFWQLDRLQQRRTYNAAVQAAMELPPLQLDSIGADSISRDLDAFLYRSATATGRFCTRNAVLLRGRTDTGRPGVHLVIPMRLDDGRFLLVNRGWLYAPDGATADPRPYLPDVRSSVQGLLQRIPSENVDAQPLTVEAGDSSFQTYRRLDYARISAELPGLLFPLYLEATPDSARRTAEGPRPVPMPMLDEGPHFGYAVQWFSFAAIALLGPLVFVFVRRSGKGSSTGA